MNHAVDPCLTSSVRRRWRLAGSAGTALAVAAGVLLLPMSPASAAPVGQVTEHGTGISPASGPEGIAAGPDGNMWFTESNANRIARMTPAGAVHEFSGLTGTDPTSIAAGPGGYMWFTEFISKKLGRISTTTGVVTNFTTGINQTDGYTQGITRGPDGNMWFTEPNGGRIGRINTTNGVVTEFTVGGFPYDIVAGRDGNLWFTEYTGNRIGRISTSGVVTHSSALAAANSQPTGIAAGSDGNLWFTEGAANKIGRITTSLVLTEFGAGISAASQPRDIAAGPDGNLWFAEVDGQRVARITTAGVVTQFSAGITASADPWGIAAGPNGNMWFTEYLGQRIGQIGTGYPPTMTCAVKGGTTKSKLKVVCHFTIIKATAKVAWKVKRHGHVVRHDTSKLSGGKLVINLHNIATHKGKYKVTVTKGKGANEIKFHQTVHIHKK